MRYAIHTVVHITHPILNILSPSAVTHPKTNFLINHPRLVLAFDQVFSAIYLFPY